MDQTILDTASRCQECWASAEGGMSLPNGIRVNP
ncbi:hypothetical protein JOF39_002863 [Glutamicibacter protophormiae]|uniref:Uracil-DNA glycosylase n=1 Tax=Glutamicibacter protophormiae TaxID=37930 RepID=A0ABS4XTE0_GLUPR|nr:hypothetical protein [Glutamicibacter protophormiae]